MKALSDVVIVGAGPYGLSLAAYLRAVNVNYRIFGKPMQFWKRHVPPGMMLKSLGASANLFDPASSFSVAGYCADHDLPYSEETPIPVEVYADYGSAFQKQFVSDVDERDVVSIARDGDAFRVELDDGERFRAARIVISVGIRRFAYVPDVLRALPTEYVTHSVNYGSVDALVGRKVTVIGSGASAIDLAAALHERTVDVAIISRRSSIAFQSREGPRGFYHALKSPSTPIGGGWDLWFYANAPRLFHLLPENLRFRLVTKTLGPAPGWFMSDRVLGRIPIVSGQQLEHAEITQGKVKLKTRPLDGTRREFVVDHVVAATGFWIDVERLDFLSCDLRSLIAQANGAPVLSRNFESSVKGLYFIGAVTAPSFGPVMRFVAGAGYTVRRVAAGLSRSIFAPGNDD